MLKQSLFFHLGKKKQVKLKILTYSYGKISLNEAWR